MKDPALKTRGIGETPAGSLSDFAPELAETFVTVASDIALVVDLDGTIRSVAVGADSPTPRAASWVGRPWVDTVTASTRRKIERLLHEAAVCGVSRRCEVDHLLPSGAGVPVAYSAVRLGPSGPVLAAGRDLRAVAAMQQRFVQAQQQMERDHWRRREAESRYRRLFQVATDAVLVVDGGTLRIVEGNPAAAERLGVAPEALAGRDAIAGFEAASRAAVASLCAQAHAGGGSGEVRARLAGPAGAMDVAVTAFRSGDAGLLLMRLRAAVREGGDGAARLAADPSGSWALRARQDTHALLARVGELSLPDLLQQAAALAERHFVQRALELSGGDRDAAARLLSLEPDALERRLDAIAPGPARAGAEDGVGIA